MKKCCLILLIANVVLINIISLAIAILYIKEKYNSYFIKKSDNIKTNKIINNRILFNNDNKTKEENNKNEFFLKNFNISLFSYDKIKNDVVGLLINKNFENYTSSIQNKFLIMKLVNRLFKGYSYSNHSLDEEKFYNSYFEFYNQTKNFNISFFNNISLYFYKGKNLTSNEEMFIIQEKNLITNKTTFLFSNAEDIIIDIDKNNSLFKLKILEAKLYDEALNNNNNCLTLIQMIFKLNDYSISIYRNNINELIKINTIENKHYSIMLKPSCLDEKIFISCYEESLYLNNNSALNKVNKNVTNEHEYNIKLIIAIMFSSLINFIYNIKFIINISQEKITIHSFCLSSFYISLFYYCNYMFYSIDATKKYFHENYNLIIKFISLLSSIFSTINFLPCFILLPFFSVYLLCNRNNDTRPSCIHMILLYLSIIINLMLYIELKSETFFILIPCITWAIQIIKNIIFKNKYILPLFYYLFFTIEKFIFIILDNNMIIPNYKKYLLLLIINIAEIIIIFMQGYYDPRFMFGSLFKEKNNTFYRSKDELLREKPNCKDEFCSICLLPFINNNKNNINNSTETKTNNEITIEKDNFNTSKENSKNDINNNKIITVDNIIIEQKNKNRFNNEKLKKVIKYIFKKYFWDYYFNEPKFLRKYALFKCGHFFHSDCINIWINEERKCPICRQHI